MNVDIKNDQDAAEKKKRTNFSLTELASELERQKKNRYDIIVPSNNLIVVNDGDKIKMDVPQVDGTTKQHNITNWAHNQISNKTGIPKRYYDKMREEGKLDLLADNINTWMPDKEKRMVRVLDNNVRALLSSRYRVIDNYDIMMLSLEQFKYMMNKKNISIDIKSQNLTETNLYIKATSPDLTGEVFKFRNKTEPVHGGIIIQNSEVGAGSFQVKPFINVLVCQNGLIGEHAFKRVHIGRDRGTGFVNWSEDTQRLEDETLWAKIRDMIQSTFNPEIFHKWMDEINEVSTIEVEKPSKAIDNVIKHYNINKGMKDDLLNQFAKETPTQWGVSMAMTQVAQKTDSYEDQIKMEKIGADLLKKEATKIVTVED